MVDASSIRVCRAGCADLPRADGDLRGGYAPAVDATEPRRQGNGLWCTVVHPGHADILLGALDPHAPFVVIESMSGIHDWHEAIVSIGTRDEPQPRLVRRHTFDLLVDPSDAAQIGVHLRHQGLAGGGFMCHQFRQRQPATFKLPNSPSARADAVRGQGVELTIDLPHDGEVAVVSALSQSNLVAFMERLA